MVRKRLKKGTNKMDKKQTAAVEPQIITQAVQTPLDIIQQCALSGDVPVEKLQALFDLETQYKQREAQKAFSAAVAKFQHNCPVIEKGDSANGKPYARMDRIARTIRPHMKEAGLAVTWESVKFKDSMQVCTIDGTLLHADGYSKPIYAEIAVPKGNVSQNGAQVCASAETYAKRYALCGCLGIYTGDDDDGNAGQVDTITADQAKELHALVKAAKFSDSRVAKMLVFGGGKSIETITEGKFADCKKILQKEIAAIEELPV